MNKTKSFMNNPAYKQMTEEKRKMIELLSDSLVNKNLTEALPQVMAWKKQMEHKNISFTAEENKLLTDILMAEMTPAQRKQYESLKAFMR